MSDRFDYFPIAFDTETTGTSPLLHQVIQVGAIFCDKNLNVIEECKWNINYNEDLFDWDPEAERFHKIPLEVAKKHGIEFEEFVVEFEEKLKEHYGDSSSKEKRLIGANEHFDYYMCDTLWKVADLENKSIPVSFVIMDTNAIGAFAFGCDTNQKNAEFFGIKTDKNQLHDALYDAKLHLEIFRNQCVALDGLIESLAA